VANSRGKPLTETKVINYRRICGLSHEISAQGVRGLCRGCVFHRITEKTEEEGSGATYDSNSFFH
jgi:hypothetical protein